MSNKEINFTDLQSNLVGWLNEVARGEVVLVKRCGRPDVALISRDSIEDYVAAVNPRINKKVCKARTEKTLIPFEEIFTLE